LQGFLHGIHLGSEGTPIALVERFESPTVVIERFGVGT
jgi:hypothetical protein